jgi:hypothetical protein
MFGLWKPSRETGRSGGHGINLRLGANHSTRRVIERYCGCHDFWHPKILVVETRWEDIGSQHLIVQQTGSSARICTSSKCYPMSRFVHRARRCDLVVCPTSVFAHTIWYSPLITERPDCIAAIYGCRFTSITFKYMRTRGTWCETLNNTENDKRTSKQEM